MKRDMDTIRDILLTIESHPDAVVNGPLAVDGKSAEEVGFHADLLAEARYLSSTVHRPVKGPPSHHGVRLTWEGAELLDSIRDIEIWRKTKDGAGKVGSWSIGLIGELAKAVARQKAHELGFPI